MMPDDKQKAFTLVELLVSMAIMSLLLVLLLSVTGQVSDTWRKTTNKMQAFESVRSAFDSITENLAQATLNTYWDYDDPVTPQKYERRSELHFFSMPAAQIGSGFTASKNPGHGIFFQAPTGSVGDASYSNLPNLLNAWGLFVEFGSNAAEVPTFLQAVSQAKYRYRLKEWKVPSERISLYYFTSGKPTAAARDWVMTSGSGNVVPQTLAENVILLLAVPRMPSTAGVPGDILADGNFVYDSRTTTVGSVQKNQLPPAMELIVVAIDETSAQQLALAAGTNPPVVMPSGVDFSKPADLEKNLADLRTYLEGKSIRYIVLRSTITMRAGRWSHET